MKLFGFALMMSDTSALAEPVAAQNKPMKAHYVIYSMRVC